jgi:hypothetical protein
MARGSQRRLRGMEQLCREGRGRRRRKRSWHSGNSRDAGAAQAFRSIWSFTRCTPLWTARSLVWRGSSRITRPSKPPALPLRARSGGDARDIGCFSVDLSKQRPLGISAVLVPKSDANPQVSAPVGWATPYSRHRLIEPTIKSPTARRHPVSHPGGRGFESP